MGKLVRVAAMCAALIVTTAHAQTIQGPTQLPRGPGGQGGLPLVNHGTTEPGRATTTAPNLRGSLPAVGAAPKVQTQQPIAPAAGVSPPPVARAGTPDGGDASACDCYRMETMMIRNRDGSITRRQVRRAAGTKSLACCPRR
jgi:hypothetical protein